MGAFTCIGCGTSYERDLRGAPKFCDGCMTTHVAERGAAMALVSWAIKRGQIQPASLFQCACGKPSKLYEHRDYTRPLDVEPVCYQCNKRRGAAYNSVYRPVAEVV